MRKAYKLQDIPQDLIKLLEVDAVFEDYEHFEDCEELLSYIIDWVGIGCSDKTIKKGDWYFGKCDALKIGKYKVVAKYKRQTDDIDDIEYFDCLLYKMEI